MAYSHHQSLFSYNVTRRYPFRWFTPVVVVAFIVFTVVFSILNVLSFGYTLVVQDVSNPNATISTQETWFRQWPGYFTSSMEPTCQAANIPIMSQFATNQTALTYTLESVRLPYGNSTAGSNGISPSLLYYNNIISNCTITSIDMDFSALHRSSVQIAFSEYGINIRSYSTCTIDGTNGTTFVDLVQEYDYVPPTSSFSDLYTFLGTNFLERNATTKSSLWWGESMLSVYWAYTTKTMQNIRQNQTTNDLPGIRKGTLYFTPTPSMNISSLDFFKVDFRFIVESGQAGNYSMIMPSTYGEYQAYTSISLLSEQQSYPNIWSLSDVLAKSAYSTILTDLGQVQQPNILLDPDLLTYFTSNFSEARHNIANAYPGPADQQYGTVESGPLGTTPSVIDIDYLCQVPVRKAIGNLLPAVLLADLVFLFTLWKLFTGATELLLLRNRKTANHCQGCMGGETEPILAYTKIVDDVEDMRPSSPEQVEMDSLRPSRSRVSRDITAHERSISQQRLIEEHSAL